MSPVDRQGGEARNHEADREISKNAPLRERIADELAHNDECGPGPVSWQEYLADADAILRIVGEHGPQGEDHEAGRLAKLAALAERDPYDIEAVRAYNDECKRISAQGEGIEAFKRAWDPAPLLASDERIARAVAAYLSRCPSQVGGTEPRWIEPHDALKYELGDPMDDERVSGTEPDTAKLARAEAILRVIADRGPVLDAADATAMRDRARSYFAAGFSVDAGKPAGESSTTEE